MNYNLQLNRQILFLRNSASNYDKGDIEEAIRIAMAARVLIHQTNHSTSLLTHLNSTEIKLSSSVTTVASSNESIFHGMGITSCSINNNPTLSFKARLPEESEMDKLPLQDWWNQTIYILQLPNTIESVKLSRKDLVLEAANKDGGAHVDDNIKPIYKTLLTSGSLGEIGLIIGNKEQRISIENAHFVALRQIAHELLNSPDLINLITY